MQEIKSTVKKISLDRKQRHLDQKLQDMFKWLSPLSPSARHFENQKKRVEGTGEWLIENPKFVEWSSKIAKFQTLCCYGHPGAGKTIIS